MAARQRKREKAIADLQRAERGLQNLELQAPVAGLVNILPNFRRRARGAASRNSGRATGVAGRRDPGTAGSLVRHLEARLDESDRGRLQTGQDAIVRIEAIPGREFKARINNISVLAKVDFTSGWPPPKNFDLNLVLIDVDPKIRPGMTAVARIATERIPDVVLVPAEAIFQQDGAPNVYRLAGSSSSRPASRSNAVAVSRSSSPRASNRVTALLAAGAGDDQEGQLKRRFLVATVLIAVVGAGAPP